MPSFLQSVLLLHEYRDDCTLPGVAGIAASAAVMLLVNQLRLALIGWSTQQGGLDAGYEIGHRFAGSVVGIAGFAAGLIVLIAVAGVRRRRRPARP